jgi:integrase
MATRNANGTGTMRERPEGSGHWQLRVFAGTDLATGRPRQLTKTFTGNAAAAQRALRSFVADVAAGATDQTKVTVGQLLDLWLEQITPTRAPKTVHEYRRWIDTRIRPTLGDIPITRLEPARLDAQYGAWLADGLSQSSVHHLHAILSTALTKAEKWGWVERAPTRRASPPPLRAKEITAPTPEQLNALIAEASDPVLAVAIALAALTGCRRGELSALRWSDVDLTVGRLHVRRSVSAVNGELHEGPTKTHASRRVALDEIGVGLLRDHWQWMQDLSTAAESPLVADPYLLSRRADGATPVHPGRLTDGFTGLCRRLERRARKELEEAGKDTKKAPKYPFRFHDLRHFSVTTLIAAGVDIRTVAERHGHSQATMTLNRYTHALPERDREAAGVLGRVIGDTAPPRS